MQRNSSLSLSGSLIYHDFISIGTLHRKGEQCAFFYQIDLATQTFLKVQHHAGVLHQAYRTERAVKNHKNIHIAFTSLLSARERTKHPSLQH